MFRSLSRCESGKCVTSILGNAIVVCGDDWVTVKVVMLERALRPSNLRALRPSNLRPSGSMPPGPNLMPLGRGVSTLPLGLLSLHRA